MRETYRYTTAQLAAILERDPSTIRDHARRYHMGKMITPRLRLYSEHDLTRLKAIADKGPGRNPNPR